MDILEKIRSLGFQNAEATPDRTGGGTVYKIRTTNGWTYERFTNEAEVDNWSLTNKPEGK